MEENTNITGNTGNEANGNEPEKLFTQAELDSIIGDRLKRERGKLEAKAAATLEEREAELTRREMRLETLNRLKTEGLDEALADDIKAGSKEELDYAINLLKKVRAPAGVPGRGCPPPMQTPDNIRNAMGLNR